LLGEEVVGDDDDVVVVVVILSLQYGLISPSSRAFTLTNQTNETTISHLDDLLKSHFPNKMI